MMASDRSQPCLFVTFALASSSVSPADDMYSSLGSTRVPSETVHNSNAAPAPCVP